MLVMRHVRLQHHNWPAYRSLLLSKPPSSSRWLHLQLSRQYQHHQCCSLTTTCCTPATTRTGTGAFATKAAGPFVGPSFSGGVHRVAPSGAASYHPPPPRSHFSSLSSLLLRRPQATTISTTISTTTTPLRKRTFAPLQAQAAASYCSYRMCRSHAALTDHGGAATTVSGRELLPTNVVPRHYNVTLEPDFAKLTYEGIVVIDLDVAENSSSVSLNTLELEIHSAKLSADGNVVQTTPVITYDDKTQVSKFDFVGHQLVQGTKVQLEIAFTGQLNDKMAGFYRSTYKKDDGSEAILASTQFEATDARRAIPCFDEPALKAKFTVTLIADKDLTCLSNMDVSSETEVQSKMSGGTKKAVHFNTSPLMSTYLLAFVVGELNYVECLDFRIPVRVYAPPGIDIENGHFSAKLAAKTLAFYETAFGVPFPLPKMDQVAITDFSQGAMENWGLVTYRVVDLMLDEKASGAVTKQRVAEVVQHELAHQWFGNLVTMDWWEGLWLNEGFATWASWYSCNIFYPEWHVWQTYVTDDLQSALSLDALRSSHPIEVPVKRADEINQIFDAISYSKGSCVLRMISTYLGEETFLEGVRQYLRKYAYGNTQTGDLWDSLAEVSKKPVHEIMNAWTKNVGYPVLSVTENAQDSSITVKQNRFLRTGDAKPEEDKVLYPVFLGLHTKDGVDSTVALTEREKTFKVASTDFFKLNTNHTGIYRTSYSASRLEKLGQAAKDGLLSVEDRAGMIADAGALASSGYGKTSGVLNLLKGFQPETEFVVWGEITARLGSIQMAWIFEDQVVKDGLQSFLLKLVSAKAHELGWQFSDADGHVEQQFKALMFGTAGMSGDETIIAAAKEMFAKLTAGDKSAVHPNLRKSVLSIVLKYGGEAEYEKVLGLYRTSTNSDERNTCLRSLGNAKGPEQIKKTISLILSNEVKDQDCYLPAAGLRNHAEGIIALFDWMVENWDALINKHPATLPMLGNMVSLLTSGFTTQEQLDKVDKFFAEKDKSGFEMSLEQSKDSIRSKIAWLGRDREDVANWIGSNGYSA